MITTVGEPTLTNLVDQIVNKNAAQAQKIQSVLDFVTEHIKYDEKEFYFGREFLQRFNETLIAREGDCSNKSILLASMLEQMEIEYLLVYTPNHIYVAVPSEEFGDENKYEFKFNDKIWSPAETTLKGFRIGKTLVKNDKALKDIKFVQNPNFKNQIFSYPDGKMILFN